MNKGFCISAKLFLLLSTDIVNSSQEIRMRKDDEKEG